MKNNRLNIALIVFLTLVFFGGFYFFSQNKSFIWQETYRVNDNQPYDLSVIFESLEKQKGSFNVLSQSFIENPLDSGDYLFIGENAFIEDEELPVFLDWVKKGNSAMFVAKVIPSALQDILLKEEQCPDLNSNNSYYFRDSVAFVSHLHPKLNPEKKVRFEFKEKNKTVKYDFGSFDNSQFCEESDFIPLGTIQNTYINFIQIPLGKGYIYIHVSPLLFTNYQLLSIDRAQYVYGVLSYLKSNKLYWDEYHRFQRDNYGNSVDSQTPLSFVLSNRSLRWAFYLIMSVLILYFVFSLRRKQRIIPVMEPLRNSSLEFVQATGRLYFLQRNHTKLITIQMRHFLEFIRERYRIRAKSHEDVLPELLSQRSGVSIDEISKMLNEYRRLINYVEISDAEAIAFYQMLNHFYKNCY
jgi:hypothetical protein